MHVRLPPGKVCEIKKNDTPRGRKSATLQRRLLLPSPTRNCLRRDIARRVCEARGRNSICRGFEAKILKRYHDQSYQLPANFFSKWHLFWFQPRYTRAWWAERQSNAIAMTPPSAIAFYALPLSG
jgi:hypothetical protein